MPPNEFDIDRARRTCLCAFIVLRYRAVSRRGSQVLAYAPLRIAKRHSFLRRSKAFFGNVAPLFVLFVLGALFSPP
jgi:hypothetical protein